MKLLTNRGRDHMSSLEEGLVDEKKTYDGDSQQIEKSENCNSCILFSKVMFYLLMVLFLIFIGYVGVISLTPMADSLREVENFDSVSAEELMPSSTPEDPMSSTQKNEDIPTNIPINNTSNPDWGPAPPSLDYKNDPDSDEDDEILGVEDEGLNNYPERVSQPGNTTEKSDTSTEQTKQKDGFNKTESELMVIHISIPDSKKTGDTDHKNPIPFTGKITRPTDPLKDSLYLDDAWTTTTTEKITTSTDSKKTTDTDQKNPIPFSEKKTTPTDPSEDLFYLDDEWTTTTTEKITTSTEQVIQKKEFTDFEVTPTSTAEDLDEPNMEEESLLKEIQKTMLTRSELEHMGYPWDLIEGSGTDDAEISLEMNPPSHAELLTIAQMAQRTATSTMPTIDKTEEPKVQEDKDFDIENDQEFKGVMDLILKNFNETGLPVKTAPEPLIIKTDEGTDSSDYDSYEDAYDYKYQMSHMLPDEYIEDTEGTETVTESVVSSNLDATKKPNDAATVTTSNTSTKRSINDKIEETEMEEDDDYDITNDPEFKELIDRILKDFTTTPEPLEYLTPKNDEISTTASSSLDATKKPNDAATVTTPNTSTKRSTNDKTEETKVEENEDYDIKNDPEFKELMDRILKDFTTTPETLIIKTGKGKSDYDSAEDDYDIYTYSVPDEIVAQMELDKAVTESPEPANKVIKTDVSTDTTTVGKDVPVAPKEEVPQTEGERKFLEWLDGKIEYLITKEDEISTTASSSLDANDATTVTTPKTSYKKVNCDCIEEPVFPRYPRGRPVPFISIMRMRTVCTCGVDLPTTTENPTTPVAKKSARTGRLMKNSDFDDDEPFVMDPPEYGEYPTLSPASRS